MKIGFDVISDLNLLPGEEFNWEGKATSLYLIIAGNISNDVRTIRQTLGHLSKFYQGIFYILGSFEYDATNDIPKRTEEIFKICRTLKNIALLHQHVVVIDGIAIVGANCWYGNTYHTDPITDVQVEHHRNEDILYLRNTIGKLQKHLDVKKIIVVTNSVPGIGLYFGEHNCLINDQLPPNLSLSTDIEKKVSHWIYGTYMKEVDAQINGINYINNGYFKKKQYWSKRIEVEI